MSSHVSNLRNLFQQKQDELVQGDRRVQTGLQATLSSRRERLATAQLKAARCDASGNPGLQNLWRAVTEYNQEWKHPTMMSDAEMVHAIAILDYVYETCATYMTDKAMKTLNSAGGSARRKARYEAFTVLIEEVAKEIESMGGKTLTGPTNFQENKRNYWLERLDKHHRAGYLISAKYNLWVKSGSNQTFWVWLKANGGSAIKSQSKVAGYTNPDGAQWNYCRYFDNGFLLNAINDMPFSTQGMKTEFSQAGWAVFVCSLPMVDGAGNLGVFIFSYTHRAGWDHHSSFLGGAPVMAAGEWIVDPTGKIRVITGKSGHYMPKWENLHKFVKRFQDIPGDAIIRPNMLDHNNGASTIKFYRVSDFRNRNIMATPLRKNVVMSAISSTGANAIIQEHLSGGARSLSDMLPA